MNKNDEIKVVGGFGNKCNKGTQWHNQNRVYDNKVATCIPTSFQPYYLENERERERESKMGLRIRKLVPVETMKLMGFERKDEQAMREQKMSDMAIYHCSGDSLVTTVCAMLLGQMLPISEEELQQKIENYVEGLVNEK